MINESVLTFLWTALNTLGSIQLFDGFSKRKNNSIRFWIITVSCIILKSVVLNIPFISTNSAAKIPFSIIIYTLFHLIQYTVRGIFNVYIAVIYYSITCCTENLVFTTGIACSIAISDKIIVSDSMLSLINGLLVIFICSALKQQRIVRSAKISHWKWYSVPTAVSFLSTVLIFYYGGCYKSGDMSIQPLLVSSVSLTIVQIAALFLVSWMELNAHLREETLSLHTRAQAQQESIEALSIAYEQQRKLTHDFQSHLDILAALLSGETVGDAEQYLCDLQKSQLDRVLLVNTRNTAINALLNQKASLAIKRKIDIQFTVNDLSELMIDITDLTVVISNVLDNAIEACEKIPEQERQIFVKVLLEDGALFFSVRNRSNPVVIIPGQLPLSTKTDASLHGYGLKNVTTTLMKRNALCSINYDSGWFSFATELPNTAIS